VANLHWTWAALVLSLALAGCVQQSRSVAPATPTTAPLDIPEFNNSSAKLPAVSLFRLKAPAQFSASCNDYQARSPSHRCELQTLAYDRLQQALAATGQFEAVALADDDNAYSLVLASAARRQTGAATLTMEVVADVYWFDQKLQRFSYQLAIPAAGNPQPAGLYDSVAAHLVRDLQNNATLSKETLHRALQSSRYQHELKAAPLIGAFAYRGMQVLHNPAYGASMRYEHTEYNGAYLDVFVYPILDWRFTEPERLNEEVQALRRDLNNLDEQGLWQALRLNDTRELPGTDSASRIVSFDGEYRSNEGQLLATTAHLYRQGDKFVKIRASFPKYAPVRSTVEAFVRALPDSLEVPGESPFMARLREDWRRAAAAQ